MNRQAKETKAKIKKRWASLPITLRRFVLMFGLVFVLVGGVISYPHIAMATCGCRCTPGVCSGDITSDPIDSIMEAIGEGLTAAKNAIENSQFVQMLTGILKFISFWIEQFAEWLGLDQMIAALKIMANNLMGRTIVKTTEAIINAHAADAAAAVAGERARKHPQNTGADQFLCNVITTRFAIPAMEEFTEMVGIILAQGIDSTYRGPNDQGNGPMYSAHRNLMRRGLVEGYDIKTESRLDGVDKKHTAPLLLSEVGTTGMDTNADYLSRGKVYTLPPAEIVEKVENGTTIKTLKFKPNPEDESQRRWMKASQYCYNLAADPSPPHGSRITTPGGIPKFGRMTECRAKRAEFLKICTTRLGKLTRPDCSNKDYQAFCDVSISACAAAKEAHLSLGAEYENCENGLSLSQLERVSTLLCGSTRRLQTEGMAGSPPSDGPGVLTLCAQLKQSWESQIKQEDEMFQDAIRGIILNKDCFASAGK